MLNEGDQYGRLTVVKLSRRVRRKNGTYLVYLCRCQCGREVEVQGSSLRSGHTKSCGCYAAEKLKQERPDRRKPKPPKGPKRIASRFPYGGEMLTVKELVVRTGIKEKTLRRRIFDLGWDIEKATSTLARAPRPPKWVQSPTSGWMPREP